MSVESYKNKNPELSALLEQREGLASYLRRIEAIVETRMGLRALKGKRGLLQVVRRLIELSDVPDEEKKGILTKYDQLQLLNFELEDLLVENANWSYPILIAVNKIIRNYKWAGMDLPAETLVKKDHSILETYSIPDYSPLFGKGPNETIRLLKQRIEVLDRQIEEVRTRVRGAVETGALRSEDSSLSDRDWWDPVTNRMATADDTIETESLTGELSPSQVAEVFEGLPLLEAEDGDGELQPVETRRGFIRASVMATLFASGLAGVGAEIAGGHVSTYREEYGLDPKLIKRRKKADEHYKLGNFSAAEKGYRINHNEGYPLRQEILYKMAHCYLEMREEGSALEVASKGFDLVPAGRELTSYNYRFVSQFNQLKKGDCLLRKLHEFKSRISPSFYANAMVTFAAFKMSDKYLNKVDEAVLLDITRDSLAPDLDEFLKKSMATRNSSEEERGRFEQIYSYAVSYVDRNWWGERYLPDDERFLARRAILELITVLSKWGGGERLKENRVYSMDYEGLAEIAYSIGNSRLIDVNMMREAINLSEDLFRQLEEVDPDTKNHWMFQELKRRPKFKK